MTLYTKAADTAVVLQAASSSPGTGWSSIANVQAAFDQARSAGLPLFVLPGTYTTTEIVIDTSLGGQPLWVYATPGTVTLELTSGDNLLYINGIYGCKIENINFNGNNVNFSNLSDSSALISLNAANLTQIMNCQIYNSVSCGIYGSSSSNTIRDCAIYNCSYGIWTLDSFSQITSNQVNNCANNGIMVWTSSVAGNNSNISNNLITSINSGSGTGQNGNGIGVFRAIAVNVIGNSISGCQYSAIRVNGGGDVIVVGNNCYGSRETAIFLEAPIGGIDLNGGVVCANMVDTAGNGISVANSGQGGQGTARSVAVTGNRVTGIVHQTINDPGYIPTVSIAFGISVETTCVVSGNLIDNAAGVGINVGHNSASGDVNTNGNLILSSPLGVGYSAQSGAGNIVISSNEIQGATTAAIISCYYDDTTDTLYVVSGATDYGNQYDAQEGIAFVGNNRSY
ncbi:MAG: TIGR03808 family TAT-translocated repetitive protein [Methylovirgula sp.]